MLIQDTIKVNITCRNITYYKNKGFDCKVGETIEVCYQDLFPNCTSLDTRKCDICGQEYTRRYDNNKVSFERFGKDVCPICFKKNKKVKQMVQDKREKTFIEKYGETNPMFVPELVEKIGETMKNKYGVENPSQVEEFKKKQEETMLNLYGARKALQIKQFQEKFVKTISENYSVKTSSQQVACYNMLIEHGYKATLNYPFSNVILDVLIELSSGEKIDFEYDGSYWHDSEQKKKDRRRDEFLKKNGFKIIRIESKRSVPTWQQIQDEIDYLLKDSNHSFTHLLLDEENK